MQKITTSCLSRRTHAATSRMETRPLGSHGMLQRQSSTMYVPSFMLLKTSAKRSSHRRQTTNKVTLTAKPKTWEDAFDHWQLKISSKGITPQSAHSSRSLVKRIGYNGTVSTQLEITTNCTNTPNSKVLVSMQTLRQIR